MSLFGVPGAEDMEFSLQDAYESQVDWWIGDGEDLSDPPMATIEEWSELPPGHHIPTAERIIDWISETIADEGELSDTNGAESFDRALRESDVVELAERLRGLISSKVTWRQAGALKAVWTVTLDGNGNPEFTREER